MTTDEWILSATLLGIIVTLVSGRVASDIVFLGAVFVLLSTGVVTPEGAFAGFANTSILTVAFLYVVATGAKETGATEIIARPLLQRVRSTRDAQARLLAPVVAMSAFVNNTPIVSMFIPVLTGLSKRTGIAPSKLFMPLSFASILGGVCTLIGTSTNVVVAGLVATHNRQHPASTVPEFTMFTITVIGLPVALIGLLYIVLFANRLLPSHADRTTMTPASAREYKAALRVTKNAPISGKTIEEAGLRHLPGAYLSEIERSDGALVAVGPEEVLATGDVLLFVGSVDSVVDLQSTKGLVPLSEEDTPLAYRSQRRLIEAVISAGSPLIGRSIRDAEIRTHYGAVVVAVHRHGHRLTGKLGDVVLRPGDTLLLEGPDDFARKYRDSADFMLVSALSGRAAPRHDRAYVALAIMAGLIVVMSLGLVEPVIAAMGAAALMIVTRCCTGAQARSEMNWEILMTIASAVCIGRAVETTGLGAKAAAHLIEFASPLGFFGIAGATYFLTVLFTSITSNNAAAILMFPIGLSVAQTSGVSFLPLAVLIAVGASCEFSTPIGYQTNLMVMGPGGYRWVDYTRFGTPLTILSGVVAVLSAYLVWGS
ncbi:MAG: SLC13 family permease [Deltaproteobacteria bacterium]|nr:SLC13 family permease [Deltaproteobacteria bacterium]